MEAMIVTLDGKISIPLRFNLVYSETTSNLSDLIDPAVAQTSNTNHPIQFIFLDGATNNVSYDRKKSNNATVLYCSARIMKCLRRSLKKDKPFPSMLRCIKLRTSIRYEICKSESNCIVLSASRRNRMRISISYNHETVISNYINEKNKRLKQKNDIHYRSEQELRYMIIYFNETEMNNVFMFSSNEFELSEYSLKWCNDDIILKLKRSGFRSEVPMSACKCNDLQSEKDARSIINKEVGREFVGHGNHFLGDVIQYSSKLYWPQYKKDDWQVIINEMEEAISFFEE
eukprot:gb/GECH01009805.1/.p1 GENE.gb/GECH01009805.1/~~gb/GECH01009805.1/.p1  ORF type:complete len:287 (+),score=15.78 gb/GECH01009805.1/:1-861(+)